MLASLLVSPLLGFILALVLFKILSAVVRDKHLYDAPEGDKPPLLWMRALLILTCTGVSFAHGTNDGQKSRIDHADHHWSDASELRAENGL